MFKKLCFLSLFINIIMIYLVLQSTRSMILIGIAINFTFTFFMINIFKEKLNADEHKTLFKEEQTHFIFNSLNTIAYYCRINSEVARRLVVELSNYMRSAFGSNSDKIDIKEELIVLQSYIYIQSVRFENNFKFEKNIECKDLMIPRLLLVNLIQLGFAYGLLKQKGAGAILEVNKCGGSTKISLIFDNVSLNDIETSIINDDLIVSFNKILTKEYGSTLIIDRLKDNSIKLWLEFE